MMQIVMPRGDLRPIEFQVNPSYTFNIEPEDTDNLDYGTYVFDIELIKTGEIKQTSVGQFTLTSEVTFAENE